MKFCASCGKYVDRYHPPSGSKEHQQKWGFR